MYWGMQRLYNEAIDSVGKMNMTFYSSSTAESLICLACQFAGRFLKGGKWISFKFEIRVKLGRERLPTNGLRASPGENHAKPCRRCYRPDHRISSYFVCRYTLVNYLQIWYNFASSSFSLCLQGGSPREPFLYSFKTQDFIKFRCLAHP